VPSGPVSRLCSRLQRLTDGTETEWLRVGAQFMMSMRGLVESSLRSIIGFLLIKEQTHMTMLSFLSHFPGLVHFIYVDRLNFQVPGGRIC